jgi:hypothetical protein
MCRRRPGLKFVGSSDICISAYRGTELIARIWRNYNYLRCPWVIEDANGKSVISRGYNCFTLTQAKKIVYSM